MDGEKTMIRKLKGKIALVTGGSCGIGAAIAMTSSLMHDGAVAPTVSVLVIQTQYKIKSRKVSNG
jgi:NADP-dependent 3-hydroxy acid dehydrogenase YdfG